MTPQTLPCQVYGGGLPLILVHGGPALPGYMKTLGHQLQDRFTIHEPYQREAIAKPLPATLDLHADDLQRLLVQVARGGQSVQIVAHSWGAIVALELAKRQPSALAKLIVLAPAPLSVEISDQFKAAMLARLVPLYGNQAKVQEAMLAGWRQMMEAKSDAERFAAFHQNMAIYWRGYFPSQRAPDEFNFAMIQLDTYQASINDYRQRLSRDLLRANLGRITAPVVHLHGTADPIPWKQTHQLLQQELKNTDYQFIALEKMGHFPWVDNPARLEFLQQLHRTLVP